MGTTITRESIAATDTESLSRMWNDLGDMARTVVSCDQMPDKSLIDLADWIWDELSDRGATIECHEDMEMLLGIVTVEECDE